MIGHFTDDDSVLNISIQMILKDLHRWEQVVLIIFLRTKISPLVLNLTAR